MTKTTAPVEHFGLEVLTVSNTVCYISHAYVQGVPVCLMTGLTFWSVTLQYLTYR